MDDETTPPFPVPTDPAKPVDTVQSTTTTTTTSARVAPADSHFMNMSVRAWIAFLIVITVCVLALGIVYLPVFVPQSATTLTTASIPDVMKDGFFVVLGYYMNKAAEKPKSPQ